MPLNVPPRTWLLAERLYIHCHAPEDFLALLRDHEIAYTGEPYAEFGSVKGKYTFMSEDNFAFASFMQGVPTYKYVRLLEDIVFDNCVQGTKDDNWNYYGEYIHSWYPELVDLLRLSGIDIQIPEKKLVVRKADIEEEREDFLAHSFNDPFLDHIRKEVNEAHAADLYLSVMVLTRKILEVVLVRTAEVVFPKLVSGEYSEANHEIWYDRSRNSVRGLDQLIQALRENSFRFQEDRNLVEELLSLVKPLKNEMNAVAHADYKVPDAGYLRQWRIPHVVNLSRRIFRKYCNP